MSREDINQLPVLSNGKIEGIFYAARCCVIFRPTPNCTAATLTAINSFREQERPET